MKRVPPSKATKARIEELLGAGVSEGSPLSELLRHRRETRGGRQDSREGRLVATEDAVRRGLPGDHRCRLDTSRCTLDVVRITYYPK